MTETTIFGTAARVGGIASDRTAAGRTVGTSFNDISLELPTGGVQVDLDHNHQRVGELIYGEVAADGRVNVVCVLDDDRISNVHRPVFFSAELLMIGNSVRSRSSYVAREAQLLSLALTLDPATLGARPVKVLPGDIRDSLTRANLPMSWRSNYPLLARAIDEKQGSSLRTRARRIVDLRVDSGSDYPWDEAPARVRRALGDVGRRQTGKLRHSGAAGRVLDVR